MRNELECHTIHRWLPALYLYYRPHRNRSPSLLFSRRLLTTTKGCIKVEGRPRRSLSLRPLQASEAVISLFFLSLSSGSFFSFLRNGRHKHPHNIRSSLHWHHRLFIVRVKPPLCHTVVDLGCRLTDRAFCCSIFGILSMQCYTYYHRYPLDRPFYKILVR